MDSMMNVYGLDYYAWLGKPAPKCFTDKTLVLVLGKEGMAVVKKFNIPNFGYGQLRSAAITLTERKN